MLTSQLNQTSEKRSAVFAVRVSLFAALSFVVSIPSSAQSPGRYDLTQLNLEDLLNVQVTSVSKREQTLAKTGAAVFVISQEDIRRSGMDNIPDLLRMAPGVHVAQMNPHTWAISIRGFTDKYGDKVLVMIDGRSVYTPLTSGVNWDHVDVPLENIDRIEVIRGPGGTVWGANAVNGVINIITRNSKATLGGLVGAVAGSEKALHSLAQYGGQIGGKGTYRVFGSFDNHGNAPAPPDETIADGWHKAHLGFRSDWDVSPTDSLSIQSDLFRAREGQTLDTIVDSDLPAKAVLNSTTKVIDGSVLGRWDHTLSNGSGTSLQVYYDGYSRNELGIGETRNTLDVDFQQHLTVGLRHNIMWGGGYRVTGDQTIAGLAARYLPADRTDHLFSTFLQDQIRLVPSLWLTVGTKLEHNSYTGFEYEPSLQLVWNLSDKQTLWTSASRAIRQPARSDFDILVDVAAFNLDTGGIGVIELTGSTNRKAERLYDFEVGYRAQVTPKFSLDIATFSGIYHGLQTQEDGDPFFATTPGIPHVVFPTYFSDKAHAHNYGAELAANWNVTHRWKLSPGYSFLQMHVAGDPSSHDPDAGAIANESPKHQFQIRSFVNLMHNWQWEAAVFRVGALKDGGFGPTPAYTRVDTRLGWRVGESVEVGLVGQNLLSPDHAEYHNAFQILHSLVSRSVFCKVTWRF